MNALRSHVVLILIELGIGEGVADAPVEGIVKELAAQSGLHTVGVAFASIHHHATVVAIGLHDGELLVANLHVVEREVEM